MVFLLSSIAKIILLDNNNVLLQSINSNFQLFVYAIYIIPKDSTLKRNHTLIQDDFRGKNNCLSRQSVAKFFKNLTHIFIPPISSILIYHLQKDQESTGDINVKEEEAQNSNNK